MMRNCSAVIINILSVIPEEEVEFIDDLKDLYSEMIDKTDNNLSWWIKLIGILKFHIEIPTEDWEYKVLSIYSLVSVNDLKSEVDNMIENN